MKKIEFNGFKIAAHDAVRSGEMLFCMGNARCIGVDLGSREITAECEFQRRVDGSIEILDIREYPNTTSQS